ncbi:hypothetical protein [Aneurinibacillus aneurinilyticus]|uniref:hypothetical protein n=1 Tax=Aneurinibacillus aneurinilyticus TaxID=1391 RepID=UPI00352525EC
MDNDLSENESAQRQAIDEFIASTSRLSSDQIGIVTRINREIIKAFRLNEK